MTHFLKTLSILGVLSVLTGGIWFYHVEKGNLQKKAEIELQTVAHLKIHQIAQWRKERVIDAGELAESPLVSKILLDWLTAPQPENTEKILRHFQYQQRQYRYNDITLVDAYGIIRMNFRGRTGSLTPLEAPNLKQAFHGQRILLTDILMDPIMKKVRMDVIVPLFSENKRKKIPAGAVILGLELEHDLYPLIQSWPTPNDTAETLLVRRDGKSVLYLNELRHRKNTALNLRIPLQEKNVPAVMAVLGQRGIVSGRDYRGIQVFADLDAIPHSTWFIVAKIDQSEAMADWRSRSSIILVLILSLMTIIAIGVGIIWQRNDKIHFRKLFVAEAAKRASEERYRTTLMSVGDGVIATNAKGEIELLNPVAETLTGWTIKEAIGKPFNEVFRIINEETRQPVANPVERVLGEKMVVGLADHTLLIDRNGREYPIADSGAPVYGNNHEMIGVVLVFRDQTEEREAEKNLTVALGEKERLLLELQHRVKNSLNMISSLVELQSLNHGDSATQKALQNIRNRILSVAKLYDLLAGAGDEKEIRLDLYLSSVARSIFSTFTTQQNQITLDLQCSEIKCEIKRATWVGLILNELLTNALKYAFAAKNQGRVEIKLQQNAQAIVLVISDNGAGLPADFDLNNFSGLGMRLIGLLAKQLNGTLDLTSDAHTTFRLTFPV